MVSHRGVLQRGGNLVVKLLEGEGTRQFAAQLKSAFEKVQYARPAATRQESREVYLVGLGRRTCPSLLVSSRALDLGSQRSRSRGSMRETSCTHFAGFWLVFGLPLLCQPRMPRILGVGDLEAVWGS
jgi:hypothetical protein